MSTPANLPHFRGNRATLAHCRTDIATAVSGVDPLVALAIRGRESFALAGLIGLATALVTGRFYSLSTALDNPVKSPRTA